MSILYDMEVVSFQLPSSKLQTIQIHFQNGKSKRAFNGMLWFQLNGVSMVTVGEKQHQLVWADWRE